MPGARRALVRAAVATALVLPLVVGAPAGAGTNVAPFTYRFRVVGFSLTATDAYWSTSATIRYRLLQPSVDRSIAYLGSRPTNRLAAWKLPYAGPIVDVAAKATYASRDPSCTSTFQYQPSGNKVVQVYVELDPRIGAKRVKASVRRIPIASPQPGEDGTQPDYSTKPRPKCGKAEMGDAYIDAAGFAEVEQMAKRRVTIRGHGKQASIEWDIAVVLERVSYRTIDCSAHPGC